LGVQHLFNSVLERDVYTVFSWVVDGDEMVQTRKGAWLQYMFSN
jgi:hypothetical protein